MIDISENIGVYCKDESDKPWLKTRLEASMIT